jgi:hypothetical protein
VPAAASPRCCGPTTSPPPAPPPTSCARRRPPRPPLQRANTGRRGSPLLTCPRLPPTTRPARQPPTTACTRSPARRLAAPSATDSPGTHVRRCATGGERQNCHVAGKAGLPAAPGQHVVPDLRPEEPLGSPRMKRTPRKNAGALPRDQILGLYELLDRLVPGPMVTCGSAQQPRPNPHSPATTPSTPSAPTCSQATTRQHMPPTAWPPAAPGQRSAPPDRYDWPPRPPGIMLPAHPHPLFTGSRKRSNPPGRRASVDPG